MQGVSRKRLIVLDPALGPEGGHHAALLERAYGALVTGEFAGSVEFYSNWQLSENLRNKFSPERMRIVPFFKADFYRYYAEKPSMAEANGYIAALGREYLSALKRIVVENSLAAGPGASDFGAVSGTQSNSGQLIVFYPAMQWVHLQALHFALCQLDSGALFDQIEHRLCLMYNPGRDYSGALLSASEQLSYKLACKSLVEHVGVKMYASDYELADHYGQLLELDTPLPLHPQYLTLLGSAEKIQKTDRSGKTIGLYFGDAKVEKGFNRLPALLESLLPAIGDNDQVVIQYVSQGNCPRVLAAEDSIREIAASQSRIRLIPTYLAAEQMQTVLLSLDVFIFTYDVAHYRNKSSGFLWLLANRSCKLVILGDSWLSREAGRLQTDAQICADYNLAEVLRYLLTEGVQGKGNVPCAQDLAPDTAIAKYRSHLYQPFFNWLFPENQLVGVGVSSKNEPRKSLVSAEDGWSNKC